MRADDAGASASTRQLGRRQPDIISRLHRGSSGSSIRMTRLATARALAVATPPISTCSDLACADMPCLAAAVPCMHALNKLSGKACPIPGMRRGQVACLIALNKQKRCADSSRRYVLPVCQVSALFVRTHRRVACQPAGHERWASKDEAIMDGLIDTIACHSEF